MKTFKEIRLRPNIATHDLQTKLKQIGKFLEKGLQVRVTMTMRGRENLFKDQAEQTLSIIAAEFAIAGLGKADPNRKFQGKSIQMTISPFKKREAK